MTTAVRTTIDARGRLLVPKPVREELGITCGTPLSLSIRNGRLEIEPVHAGIRTVERDGLMVAQLIGTMPPLAEADVRATRRRLRERG